MLLVVTLTIRPGELDTFRAFEQQAARIMTRHGGAIEQTVFIPAEASGAPMREVHVVSFSSPEAFAAYRADPALAALVPLREKSVLKTEILTGEPGPQYGD